MWHLFDGRGNEYEAVIKALLMGCEKVKGLSVLSLEIEKDFCDV